jgi:hypothetical protein
MLRENKKTKRESEAGSVSMITIIYAAAVVAEKKKRRTTTESRQNKRDKWF